MKPAWVWTATALIGAQTTLGQSPLLPSNHCLLVPETQSLCFRPSDTLGYSTAAGAMGKAREVTFYNRGSDTAWFDSVDVQVDTSKFKTWYVSFGVNPSKFGAVHFNHKNSRLTADGFRVKVEYESLIIPPRDSVKLSSLNMSPVSGCCGGPSPNSPGALLFEMPVGFLSGAESVTLVLVSWMRPGGTGLHQLAPIFNGPKEPFEWRDGLGRILKFESSRGNRFSRPSTVIFPVPHSHNNPLSEKEPQP